VKFAGELAELVRHDEQMDEQAKEGQEDCGFENGSKQVQRLRSHSDWMSISRRLWWIFTISIVVGRTTSTKWWNNLDCADGIEHHSE
jgi:hypothetical protein